MLEKAGGMFRRLLRALADDRRTAYAVRSGNHDLLEEDL
jgi:hypothetical protein